MALPLPSSHPSSSSPVFFPITPFRRVCDASSVGESLYLQLTMAWSVVPLKLWHQDHQDQWVQSPGLACLRSAWQGLSFHSEQREDKRAHILDRHESQKLNKKKMLTWSGKSASVMIHCLSAPRSIHSKLCSGGIVPQFKPCDPHKIKQVKPTCYYYFNWFIMKFCCFFPSWCSHMRHYIEYNEFNSGMTLIRLINFRYFFFYFCGIHILLYGINVCTYHLKTVAYASSTPLTGYLRLLCGDNRQYLGFHLCPGWDCICFPGCILGNVFPFLLSTQVFTYMGQNRSLGVQGKNWGLVKVASGVTLSFQKAAHFLPC